MFTGKRGIEALVAAAGMDTAAGVGEPAPKRSIREKITIKLDVYKDQFSASDLMWIEKGDVDRHTRILSIWAGSLDMRFSSTLVRGWNVVGYLLRVRNVLPWRRVRLFYSPGQKI